MDNKDLIGALFACFVLIFLAGLLFLALHWK